MNTLNFGLFPIVEYLLGGMQFLMAIYLPIFLFVSNNFKISEGLFFLFVSSIAYFFGILADNIVHMFIILITEGWSKLMKEITKFNDAQDEHRGEYNKLLKSKEEYLIKRALGFESSKRVLRLGIFNCTVSIIVTVWIMLTAQYENVIYIYLGTCFILGVFAVLCLVKVTNNYEKYLSETDQLI